MIFSFLLYFAFFGIDFSTTTCPSGSVASFSNPPKCYHFRSQFQNWVVADESCKAVGGNLTSIHDMLENVFISGEAARWENDGQTILTTANQFSDSDYFWSGGNTLVTPDTWSWIDESFFDFTDWDKGQPQNVSGNNCVAINTQSGHWIATDCYQTKPFVCKVVTETSATTMAPKPTSCQPSWTYYIVNGTTGYCYKVMDNATWTDAENFCRFENSHLSSVHTLDEALFLAYLAYFAGAEPCYGNNMAWIGGYSDDNNVNFYWTDGTPFDFTAWPIPGGKPTALFPRSCVVKYLTTECQQPASTFDDMECERVAAKFICKKSPQ